ncbi:hypothetical protein EG68_10272 [Paragonimus skrjabini miyazakii]|uniref:Uncharacterized protein n=1 Tax=Paragonimus skrjabini miyazakii TaxID=59628 RepID=A0A8S9YGC3_9TREM|nr:hypothetical protein EG68_10272 [Paragonimus skrjabini miyazakii]
MFTKVGVYAFTAPTRTACCETNDLARLGAISSPTAVWNLRILFMRETREQLSDGRPPSLVTTVIMLT